ncbi:MAG: methyltransferase domain-containing protein [Acidobacteriota bacterium]
MNLDSMRLLTPDRIYEQELLDAGDGTDDEVVGNLSDLRRLNQLLGGTRVVIEAVSSSLASAKEVSLLDVGTGSADIPSAVAARLRSLDVNASVTAMDVSERNLRLTRSRLTVDDRIALVRADAFHLPFADDSFDFVIASQFLHHFREDEIIRLLEEFARVAERKIIIHDLMRNLAPYYFLRAAGAVFQSRLTRNDAPVSVLRGFTPEELRQLARRAGLSSFCVRRFFPYRLLMIADVSDE